MENCQPIKRLKDKKKKKKKERKKERKKEERCQYITYRNSYSFIGCNSPPKGHGLLIFEFSRSHSDTPQSVGLLWTNDQLVAETST